MSTSFFEKPILNSPYEYPSSHWELDENGQPTQRIIERRRPAEFVTPIPKPRKRRGQPKQQDLVFDEGLGLSTQEQQYEQTSTVINALRAHIDRVQFLTAEELFAYIETLEAGQASKEETVHGYNVKVNYQPVDAEEKAQRKNAVSQVILKAMARMKGK